MEIAKLQLALAEANEGLLELSEKFETLSARKAKLEAVVASLTAFIATVPSKHVAVDAALSPEQATTPQWKLAYDVLTEAKRAMSVPQIISALARKGIEGQGDGLRVAMIRRPDLFCKVAYGFYGLVQNAPRSQDPERASLLQ